MPLPSWREPVDVLVVGAGAAGAAFTWSVSREGLQVLCLEEGDWVDPASYAITRADWEAARQTEWHPDANVRGLAADDPAAAAGSRLSGPGVAITDHAPHVQRRGPQHHPLERALPALQAVGLPREDTRRRGRRLAAHVRGDRAVLRPERPDDGSGRPQR